MIKPLTSFRFLFALMVFMHHLGFLSSTDEPVLKWLYDWVFKEGYIGVNFFYVLSGFILSHKYYNPLRNGEKSKLSFLSARIARIYPLHFLTFLIALPLTFAQDLANLTNYIIKLICNLTLIHSLIPIRGVFFSFNSVSWSISNELIFYITFPYLILLLSKVFKSKYRGLVVLLIVIVIPVLMVFVSEDYHHSLFYIHPFFRLFDFAIGIIIYFLRTRIREMSKVISYSFIEFLALFILAVFFYFHPEVSQVSRYSVYYWFPISFLILVFSFQGGWFSRVLSNRLLFILGEISFGFYLFHQVVLRYFNILNTRYFNLVDDYVLIFLLLSISILISYFSFYFFEKPARTYLRGRFESSKYGT